MTFSFPTKTKKEVLPAGVGKHIRSFGKKMGYQCKKRIGILSASYAFTKVLRTAHAIYKIYFSCLQMAGAWRESTINEIHIWGWPYDFVPGF